MMTSTMPRVRPQISLLSALLLMTIVGMAIVIAQLWSEVGPIREEVRRLRDEVGELSIEDMTRMHAIEVRTGDPLMWKWRMWVPEGQTVVVRSQWGEVPRTGVPRGSGSVSLEPGEQWITYRAQPDSRGDSWTAKLETATGWTGAGIRNNDRWWQWPTTTTTGEGVGFTTKIANADENSFLLKRLRIGTDKNSSQLLNQDSPTAGFIIWLERQ